jgi:hypothetical protein
VVSGFSIFVLIILNVCLFFFTNALGGRRFVT